MLDSSPTDEPCSAKGRKRCPDTHHAILKAAAELLEERGYGGVCIEAIATRAGVGKQTIYRWWSSKAAVLMEAYAAETHQNLPIPDTGSVRQDLFQYLHDWLTILTTTSAARVISGLIAEAQLDPGLAKSFREQFTADRRAAKRTILERGVERGELRSDLDLELAVDALYGAVWYRLLLQEAPLNDVFVEALVNQLMIGIAAR